MRKLKNWQINKRLYNIKRNENLICLGALLDIETFNKMNTITSQKGISNLEYVRECYKLVKREEIDKLRLETEGIDYTEDDIPKEIDYYDMYGISEKDFISEE